MLEFIIIGMICSNQGCYWANVENRPIVYESLDACRIKADDLRSKSVMYFKTDCLVALTVEYHPSYYKGDKLNPLNGSVSGIK